MTPPVGVVTVSPVLRRPRDLSKRVLARSAAVCGLATLIAGGCGPIEYLNQVASKAASAVAAAKQAEADRYAPYEYTAAEEYLHKAREEAGYAQYQDSIEYGHKAEDMAHRARAIALNHLSQPASKASAQPSKDSEGIEPPTPPAPARRTRTRAKPASALPGPAGMEEDPPNPEPGAASSRPVARPNQ